MSSKKKKTMAIRSNKGKKAGKIRKRKLAKGSTPVFPIHVPDHEEKSE